MGKLVFKVAEGTVVQPEDSTPSIDFTQSTASYLRGIMANARDPLYRNVIYVDGNQTVRTSTIIVKDSDVAYQNAITTVTHVKSENWVNKRYYNIFNRDSNGYSFFKVYYRIISDELIEFLLVYYNNTEHEIRYRTAQVTAAGKSTNKAVTSEYVSSFNWIRLATPSDITTHRFSNIGALLIGSNKKALIKYDKLSNDHYAMGLSIEETNDSAILDTAYSSETDEDTLVIQPISYNQYINEEIIAQAVNTINAKISDVVNDFQQTFVSR